MKPALACKYTHTHTIEREIKDTSSAEDSKLLDNDAQDEDVDESIESVPFISEPVKKKRARSQK